MVALPRARWAAGNTKRPYEGATAGTELHKEKGRYCDDVIVNAHYKTLSAKIMLKLNLLYMDLSGSKRAV